MAARRADRIGEHRTALEKNKQMVLKTQRICGICGKPVDFSFKSPHPLSPTVDHIIPVSKGGHPSDLANLQLAHRTCNRSKSDKLLTVSSSHESESKKVEGLPQHYAWSEYDPDPKKSGKKPDE